MGADSVFNGRELEAGRKACTKFDEPKKEKDDEE